MQQRPQPAMQTVGVSWDITDDEQSNAYVSFTDGLLIGKEQHHQGADAAANDGHNDNVTVSELSDFSLHNTWRRCFSVHRRERAGRASPGHNPADPAGHITPSAPTGFVQCVASIVADGASSVARHLSFCEAVLIATGSQDVLTQALSEAWMAYFNSGGLRNRVVYVVVPPNCRRLQESASRIAVDLMQRSFASRSTSDSIGYPVLRVFALNDFITTAPGAEKNFGGRGGRLCDSRRIVLQCFDDIQDSCRPAPLCPMRPVSSACSYAYDVVPHTASLDQTACRVYVIAKNTQQRQLHVCVIGGVLCSGSRLLFPPAAKDDAESSAAYLTVSRVERWGSALEAAAVPNHAPKAEDAAPSKPAAAVVGRPGDVCTIDFRQLAKGFAWNHVPVDVVVGSGLLVHPHSTGVHDDWHDGLFPKQPVAVAIRSTPGLVRALALLAAANNNSEAPGVPTAQSPARCGSSCIAISFDGDAFFAAQCPVTTTGEAATASAASSTIGFRLSPIEPTWVLSCLGITVRPSRRAVKRQQRLKRLHHARLPMRPVIARVVIYDAAAGAAMESLHVDVVAVQGASYVLDAVVQCCAWLSRDRRLLLDRVIEDLTVRREIPLRCTALPQAEDRPCDDAGDRHVAKTATVPLGIDTAGRELVVPVPPYCSGACVFSFLLNTFVVNNGRTLAVDGTAAPADYLRNALAAAASTAASSAKQTATWGKQQQQQPHSATTPLFVRWGSCLLPPLLSGLASMPEATVLKTLTANLLDYILVSCDPEQLPVRTLAVIAPVVLHHILRTTLRRITGATAAQGTNAPQSTATASTAEDSCLDVLVQTRAATRYVSECHRRGVQFSSAPPHSPNNNCYSGLFRLLKESVVGISHHFAATGSKAVPLPPDFFRKLVQCDARFQMRDVCTVVKAPRHTGNLGGWKAGPLLPGSAFEALSALVQSKGVSDFAKQQCGIDHSTIVEWSAQRFLVAEALLMFGPTRLVGSNMLLIMTLSFL